MAGTPNFNPPFSMTPHIGFAILTSGQGTRLYPTYPNNCWDIMTGQNNGTTMENIHAKCLGDSTPNMIRLWLQNSTPNAPSSSGLCLFHEMVITPVTTGPSGASWEGDWQPPNTMYVLPSGWKLVGTINTLDGSGYAVSCMGGDF